MFTSPLDLRQNIDWYRNNYPLEYQELVHDWCLNFRTYSRCIELYCKDSCIFEHMIIDRNRRNSQEYEIRFVDGDKELRMKSEYGFMFHTYHIANRPSNKTWLKPLTVPAIQSMLGILTFSETSIQFVNRSLK